MRIISVGGVSVWKVNLDVLKVKKRKKRKKGGLHRLNRHHVQTEIRQPQSQHYTSNESQPDSPIEIRLDAQAEQRSLHHQLGDPPTRTGLLPRNQEM